jgi:surface antigen Omp85-like protein
MNWCDLFPELFRRPSNSLDWPSPCCLRLPPTPLLFKPISRRFDWNEFLYVLGRLAGLFTVFCVLLLSSNYSLAETKSDAPHEMIGPPHPRQNNLPVVETEEQRAAAKQEEGKEEALKSLPVTGEYSYIPLPAFSYNRNEKYWVGALVSVLRSTPNDEVKDIIAPQYLHNQYIGETLSLNYYAYPSDTETYHAVVSYATKIERDFDLSYKNVAAGGGRYIIAAEVHWFKNAFRRFFGIGNTAPESDETNYTSREAVVQLTAGINLTSDIALLWTERYHDVRVDQGAVTSLPQTESVFPNLTGIGGAQIVGHKLSVRYDTRDKQLIPTKGSYVNVSAEFNQNLKHQEENQWWRFTFDARHLIPHGPGFVFAARAFMDSISGPGVPFYEEPTLGGETTLRAFGQGRFIDENALLVNFEERLPVLEKRIFDHSISLEAAPFVDIGRVYDTFGTSSFTNLQVNPGVGLRMLARPNVVGRLDIGHGRDGTNVFVGLDYPF